MRNVRFVIFVGITFMVIGILTVLMIPIASFTTGGIATLISMALFVIYLIFIDYLIDKKELFIGNPNKPENLNLKRL